MNIMLWPFINSVVKWWPFITAHVFTCDDQSGGHSLLGSYWVVVFCGDSYWVVIVVIIVVIVVIVIFDLTPHRTQLHDHTQLRSSTTLLNNFHNQQL